MENTDQKIEDKIEESTELQKENNDNESNPLTETAISDCENDIGGQMPDLHDKDQVDEQSEDSFDLQIVLLELLGEIIDIKLENLICSMTEDEKSLFEDFDSNLLFIAGNKFKDVVNIVNVIIDKIKNKYDFDIYDGANLMKMADDIMNIFDNDYSEQVDNLIKQCIDIVIEKDKIVNK